MSIEIEQHIRHGGDQAAFGIPGFQNLIELSVEFGAKLRLFTLRLLGCTTSCFRTGLSSLVGRSRQRIGSLRLQTGLFSPLLCCSLFSFRAGTPLDFKSAIRVGLCSASRRLIRFRASQRFTLGG
jgi:hypothetical protein